MHVIVKIVIPDEVLQKQEQLSREEYDIMKQHARIGEDMLWNGPSPLLLMAREIAQGHQEDPDGTSYPHGALASSRSPTCTTPLSAPVFTASPLLKKRLCVASVQEWPELSLPKP